jgi:hypothetical protein
VGMFDAGDTLHRSNAAERFMNHRHLTHRVSTPALAGGRNAVTTAPVAQAIKEDARLAVLPHRAQIMVQKLTVRIHHHRLRRLFPHAHIFTLCGARKRAAD